jgi:hypothetical protein
MIDNLKYIIGKFVMPKYPEMEGYELMVSEPNNYGIGTFVSVIYHPKCDETGRFSVTKEFKDIEDLTKSSFKMLGLEPEYRFGGVSFKDKNEEVIFVS